MNTKDMLDYAWRWFEYHAGQRMVAFRFFLILLAALVLGVTTALKDREFFLVSMLAAFGALISFAFLMLEIRNEELVNVGRNALIHVEDADQSLRAAPALQLLHIDHSRNVLISHKLWLRVIYLVCIVLFLIAAVNPRIVLAP